jgi:hypothetical protein
MGMKQELAVAEQIGAILTRHDEPTAERILVEVLTEHRARIAAYIEKQEKAAKSAKKAQRR